MTLSELSDNCETCSERAVFTGKVRRIDDRDFALLRCPSCHEEFPVWTKITADLVANWAPSLSLLASMDLLQRGNAESIAGFFAVPPAEVPFWRLTDLALPAAAARDWCRVMLSHPRLVPAGTLADRVEEALAAAIQFNDSACAAGAVARLPELSADDVQTVLMRLPGRAGDRDGAALRPFIAAVRARGGTFIDALAVAERRWALPGLRNALG